MTNSRTSTTDIGLFTEYVGGYTTATLTEPFSSVDVNVGNASPSDYAEALLGVGRVFAIESGIEMYLPKRFAVRFGGHSNRGDIELALIVEEGVVRIKEVTVWASDAPYTSVTGETLRKARLLKLHAVATAVAGAVVHVSEADGLYYSALVPVLQKPELIDRAVAATMGMERKWRTDRNPGKPGPTADTPSGAAEKREMLELIARVYIERNRSLEHTSRDSRVPYGRSRTSDYIREAKEAGLIPPKGQQ